MGRDEQALRALGDLGVLGDAAPKGAALRVASSSPGQPQADPWDDDELGCGVSAGKPGRRTGIETVEVG
jgi:hypothetical protein